MNNFTFEENVEWKTIALIAVIFFFFLEFLTNLISHLYASCLLVLELKPAVLMPLLLIIIVPIIPYIIGKFQREKVNIKVIYSILILFILLRIALPLFEDISLKIIIETLGILLILILVPIFLANLRALISPTTCGIGISLGILIGIVLKSFGSSVDISLHGWTQIIGVLLAIVALYSLSGLKVSTSMSRFPKRKNDGWRALGSILGIEGIFLIVYLGIGSPAVIARWIEGNYLLITFLISLSLGMGIIITLYHLLDIGRFHILLVNLLFLLFFGISVAICDNPSLHLLQEISMYIALSLSFILVVDLVLLFKYLSQLNFTVSQASLALILSGFLLVIFILSAIFTITWDYVRPVSAPFRDKYPLILVLIALLGCVPPMLIKVKFRINFSFSKSLKMGLVFLIIIILISSVTGVILTAHHYSKGNERELVVMAYNIQQGFDMEPHWNFEEVLEVIKKIDPDIIGLSESDTCRISSGNEDIVRFLADHLGMYSYFGPKTLSGTYGIALLSKYPILNAKTYYMPSRREQTCIIEAQIKIKGEIYNVYVTHFGEGDYDRARQANFTKELVDHKERAIVMGDFNTEPSDFYYEYLTEYLKDAWYTVHPNGTDENGYPGYTCTWKNPSSKIDMILHSPDLKPTACWVPLWAHAADHLPICATFEI